MKISEQIRELHSGVPSWRGPNSDYNEGWGHALEKAAQLVEANQTTRVVCGYCDTPIDDTPEAFAEHDAACERNPLAARVRELKERLHSVAEALRELSPGPHPGPMNAEDYVPLIAKRVAELEAKQVAHLQEMERLAFLVVDAEQETQVAKTQLADLQSQLAWTPVSEGLPTEPGVYEFLGGNVVHIWQLLERGAWQTQAGGTIEGDVSGLSLAFSKYVAFRRIQPTEAKS